MKSTLLALSAVAALGLAATPALAEPTCTTEPQSKWLSEAAMKEKIDSLGYKDIKTFHKTSTGCYEIYGYTADGKRAEVYFNPVTGDIVEAEIDD